MALQPLLCYYAASPSRYPAAPYSTLLPLLPHMRPKAATSHSTRCHHRSCSSLAAPVILDPTSSPDEILLSATAARQHRRLLPRQSTPTLSVLHSAVQRQLMLHPFCCTCPVLDLLYVMPTPSFLARLI
ncbi:hypothetical protein GW17_00042862 [Ensete ventricosum]|nr:hypothetical protein GW17_00042862 [Ensete ventricosum]RZS08015.1 hypothetical protein BHM03_00038942 [Ensete ventricosum]